jgi:hypothetical protein
VWPPLCVWGPIWPRGAGFPGGGGAAGNPAPGPHHYLMQVFSRR